MGRMTLITGEERRRRWSNEARSRILAAIDEPGAVIADVARREDICNHPTWTAAGLFAGAPALDDGWVVLMYLNKVDQVLDSEVGERHHAVVGIPVDPDDPVFDVHLAGDVEQPVFAFAEILGDATDRRHVMNLVDVHGQAA